MHSLDSSNIKSSLASPEPIDNFSIILEAPQVFGFSFQCKFVWTRNDVLK